MNAVEQHAYILAMALKKHCEQEKLPILLLVGCIESQALIRAWSETTGMNREVFRQEVRDILYPKAN